MLGMLIYDLSGEIPFMVSPAGPPESVLEENGLLCYILTSISLAKICEVLS